MTRVAARLGVLRRSFAEISPYWAAVSLVTLLGAALRFALLGWQEPWRDEAFTALVVRMPLLDMLGSISRDSAPPLSYLLVRPFAAILPEPWGLRMVAAAAGTALIPIVAALGRRTGGDAGGTWTAAFVAVVPATVAGSHDARMYMLGTTLAALATLLLWRAIERPGTGRWAAYALVAGASLWTVYFAVLSLAAALVAVALVLRPARPVLHAACLWTAAAVATIVPWLVVAHAQLEHVETPFWIEPLGLVPVAGSLVQFLIGPPVDEGVPFRPVLQALQALGFVAGTGAFLAFARRWSAIPRPRRHAALFCLVAGCVGTLVLLAVSAWRPIFDARYASVTWAPLFALAGAGLSVTSPRLARAALVALLVPSLALSVAETRPETGRLLADIEATLGPHDIVAASPAQYLLLLDEGSPRVVSRLHVLGDPVPWFWGTAAYPPGAVIDVLPDDTVVNRGRILAVGEPGEPDPTIPGGYREAAVTCHIRVCLRVFEPVR